MVCFLLRIAAVFAGGIVCSHGTESTSCLPDAVPVEQRRKVLVDGVQQPLGFLILSWQSATLNGEIFRLIAEEVLGYETKVIARSATVVAGLWGIAGCGGAVASETQAAAECELRDGVAVSQTHINFETWDFYLPATLQVMSERYPDRMPVRLGNLGFKGLSANWAPQESVQAALQDGNYLLYGPSYNNSVNDFYRYFDSLDTINTTKFYAEASRCKDYAPMNVDLDARNQLRHFPQDPDGVETYTDAQGATKYRFRCDDGVWWFSPACRANRAHCIPYLSVAGYGYSVIMHKAIHYNMAIALASTNNWVDVIHKTTVMSYTWIPDANFVDRNLQHILFPPFSQEEHDDQLYITEFAQVETEKWAHKDLQRNAPRIWAAAERMKITRSKIQSALVTQHREGLTGREAACNFLRSERDLWSTWILDVTQCQEGQGLTTVNGEQQCEWCQRATYSAVHPTITGSRICLACPAGRYQENTQAVECLPCAPGSITESEGQQSCTRCESGKFQAAAGMSECVSCPGVRTTRFQGATHMHECVCPRDTYEPLGAICTSDTDTCSCDVCGEGLSCQEGSSLSNWDLRRNGNSSVSQSESLAYPKLLPSYFSEVDKPTSVYICMQESDCPGGDPGTCAPGKTELVCARCQNGYYEFDGRCEKCSTFETQHILFPVLPVVFAPALIILFHSRLLEPFHTRNVDSQKNQALSVSFSGLVLAQTLALIEKSRMKFTTPEVATLWELSSFTTTGLDVLRPECAGGGDVAGFQTQFLIQTMLPLFAATYFAATMVITWVAGVILKRLCRTDKGCGALSWMQSLQKMVGDGMSPITTFNAFGTAMYTFSISVVSIAFNLFKCYEHPNGRASLLAAAEMLCYSDAWNGLMAVGVLAILVYCVGAMTLFGYILHVSPKRFVDERFRSTWKFLLVKWRPNCWWFGQVFLFKGLSLNLGLVLFKHGALQLWWMAATLLVYLVPVLSMHPWRHGFTNLADAATTMCMILVCICGVYNTEQVAVASDTFGSLLFVFSVAPLLGVIVCLVMIACRLCQGSDPEGVDGMRTSLFLVRMMQQLNSKGLDDVVMSMTNTTRVDRAEIRNALALLASEVTMRQIPPPGKVRLIQRASPKKNVGKTDRESWSPAAEAHVRELCLTCGPVERELRRVFGVASRVDTDYFHEQITNVADQRSADLMVSLLDLYEEGHVTRDVYRAFLEGMRQNEPRTLSGSALVPTRIPQVACAPPMMPKVNLTEVYVEPTLDTEHSVNIKTCKTLVGASCGGGASNGASAWAHKMHNNAQEEDFDVPSGASSSDVP